MFATGTQRKDVFHLVELVVAVTVGDTVQPGFGTVGHDVEAVEGVDDAMRHADVPPTRTGRPGRVDLCHLLVTAPISNARL